MQSSTPLPSRFPVGTKYVVEGRGLVVRRYVEFPDGRKMELAVRKALNRKSAPRPAGIVPDHTADVFDSSGLRRIFA